MARLKYVLAQQGWQIDEYGGLVAASPSLSAGTLPATRENVRIEIDRILRSTDDPAALLGHTKDLLETVAKTVLHETGHPVNDALDFGPLLKAGREALPLMPAGVDPNSREGKALTRWANGIFTMAQSVNELRNAVGIGHGRLGPPGFDGALARAVVAVR